MTKAERFRGRMPQEMKAALFEDPSDRFYFTGMHTSSGAVVITPKRACFLTDSRYFEEAKGKVKECEVLREKDRYAQIREILKEEGITRLFLCERRTTLQQYRQIRDALPGTELDVSVRLQELIDSQRTIKDADEIAFHQKAQQITDQTFLHIVNFIKPGMSETDIAHEIGYTMTKLGSEEKGFNYITASGPNSSKPHGFPTDRLVREGDLITMDFGALYGGRLADMTRTVALGHVSEEQKKVYDIVKQAQRCAMDMVRPGVRCCDVDKAARDYIADCGYGKDFLHGLGHSVGIEVHESPRFNPQCADVLQKGMVMTIEPGIYLEGRFGVRIEDMIEITEDGYRNFTTSPHDLIVL